MRLVRVVTVILAAFGSIASRAKGPGDSDTTDHHSMLFRTSDSYPRSLADHRGCLKLNRSMDGRPNGHLLRRSIVER